MKHMKKIIKSFGYSMLTFILLTGFIKIMLYLSDVLTLIQKEIVIAVALVFVFLVVFTGVFYLIIEEEGKNNES